MIRPRVNMRGFAPKQPPKPARRLPQLNHRTVAFAFVGVLAVGALAACGTQTGDRLASGAAIGAGAGAIAGGVGALPGAIVGAAVGALTTPEQVNLGKPPWKD